MLSPAIFNKSLILPPTPRWALTALPTNINGTNDSIGVARNASCLHRCLCSGNYNGKHTSASVWKHHQFWSIIFFHLPALSIPLICLQKWDLMTWSAEQSPLPLASPQALGTDQQYILVGKLHWGSNCKSWRVAVTAKRQSTTLLFLKQTLERISVL